MTKVYIDSLVTFLFSKISWRFIANRPGKDTDSAAASRNKTSPLDQLMKEGDAFENEFKTQSNFWIWDENLNWNAEETSFLTQEFSRENMKQV